MPTVQRWPNDALRHDPAAVRSRIATTSPLMDGLGAQPSKASIVSVVGELL
jgi:hypothetical protein